MVEGSDLIPPDGQPWSVFSLNPSRALMFSRASSIVCANHSNSLTDALCVLSSYPPASLTQISSKSPSHHHPIKGLSPPGPSSRAPEAHDQRCRQQTRSLLRLTAKATQFGKRTFTSWLIESAGTVPLKRRGDYSDDAQVDNAEVMSYLMDVWIPMTPSLGDCLIFLF